MIINEDVKLIHGDCLKVMKSIPGGSVDLILCDLPYGNTRNKWDSVIPFDELWREYSRVCRGPVVLTASQPFTSALVMSNAKHIREKIPDIEQNAIDAAIKHYRRRQAQKKGIIFDECLKIAKQHMVKVKK